MRVPHELPAALVHRRLHLRQAHRTMAIVRGQTDICVCSLVYVAFNEQRRRRRRRSSFLFLVFKCISINLILTNETSEYSYHIKIQPIHTSKTISMSRIPLPEQSHHSSGRRKCRHIVYHRVPRRTCDVIQVELRHSHVFVDNRRLIETNLTTRKKKINSTCIY